MKRSLIANLFGATLIILGIITLGTQTAHASIFSPFDSIINAILPAASSPSPSPVPTASQTPSGLTRFLFNKWWVNTQNVIDNRDSRNEQLEQAQDLPVVVASLEDRRQALADQLTTSYLNLENVQNRLSAVTEKIAIEKNDPTMFQDLIASSTDAMNAAGIAVQAFTSSTPLTVDAVNEDPTIVANSNALAETAIESLDSAQISLRAILNVIKQNETETQ